MKQFLINDIIPILKVSPSKLTKHYLIVDSIVVQITMNEKL